MIDIVNNFYKYDTKLTVVDPLVDCKEVKKVYGIEASNLIPHGVKYSSVVCLVAHKEFLKLDKHNWDTLINEDGFFFDLKGFLPRELDVIRP